jgi:DNA-binding MarR family transcriptional regulator
MPDPADEVWRLLASLVIDNQDTWKRAVVERTGLPFSRIRILSRLARDPSSVKQIAAAATIDAPAATVAVNDLEERGLVVRRVDPGNRRSKTVSLTPAGRELLALVDAVENPAPAPLRELSVTDLVALQALLKKLV